MDRCRLAAITAVPALAATPIMIPLRNAAATSIEMVQHRPVQHQRVHRTDGFRNGADDAANAHAAAPAANTPANGATRGSPACVTGLEGSASSAFPMWEVCR